MSEKSTWLLIGGAAGAAILLLGLAPAAVSISGPSILVVLALAWIVSRGARDGRALVEKARPILESASRALDDDTRDCIACQHALPPGAAYCIHCGYRALPATGRTVKLP